MGKRLSILILAVFAVTSWLSCSTAQPAAMQVAWPPDREAVDAGPVLQWQPFAGTALYRVTVTSTGADTPVFTQETAGTNVSVTPALSPGSYTWRVLAVDGRGTVLAELDSTFFVKDTVELVAPSAWATVGPEPLLQWRSYPGSARYQVIVIDDGAYPPAVAFDGATTETALAVTPPLRPGSYSWIVRAHDRNDKVLAELTGNFAVADEE